MKFRLIAVFSILSILAGVALFLSRRFVLRQIGEMVIQVDTPPKSDLIVILGGAFPRTLIEAVDLYFEGVAPRIFLNDERLPDGFEEVRKRGARIETQLEEHVRTLRELKVPEQAVISNPVVCESTRQEIDALKRWLLEHPEVKSIVLVARKVQSARAKQLFESALKGRANGYVVGSRYEPLAANNWWQDTWHIDEVSEEVLKHVYFAMARLLPLVER